MEDPRVLHVISTCKQKGITMINVKGSPTKFIRGYQIDNNNIDLIDLIVFSGYKICEYKIDSYILGPYFYYDFK